MTLVYSVGFGFRIKKMDWESVDATNIRELVPKEFDHNLMFVDATKHFLECVNKKCPIKIPLQDDISFLKIALKAKNKI